MRFTQFPQSTTTHSAGDLVTGGLAGGSQARVGQDGILRADW
jgi:hypothetical protein